MRKFFSLWGGLTMGFCDAILDPAIKGYKPAQRPEASTFYRAASIVTAPVLFAGTSALCFLWAGFELYCSLACACQGNERALDYFKASLQAFTTGLVFLMAAFLSPLVNLGDLIYEELMAEPSAPRI